MKRFWNGSVRSAHRRFHTVSGAPTVASQQRSVHPASQWRRMTTLIYSSIIATAAAADVEIKHRRNEQWDRAIAVAEQDLNCYQASSRTARGQAQQSPELDSLRHEEESWAEDNLQEYGIGDSIMQIQQQQQEERSGVAAGVRDSEAEVPKSTSNRVPSDMTKLAEEVVDRLSPTNSLDWKPLPFPRSLGAHGPHSMYASADYKSSVEVTGHSLKKKLTIEYSMAMLASHLVHKAFIIDGHSGESPELKLLQNDLDRLAESLKILRAAGDEQMHKVEVLRHPQYTQDPLRFGYEEAARKLNGRLLRCFVDYRQERLTFSAMLSRLAELLLTSSVTPNKFTFTLLLSRFRQSGHMDLASQVLTSIHEIKVRPDEMLAGAILSHYTAAKDAVRFDRYVHKLQGKGAVMLARRGIRITHASGGRLRRRENGTVSQMLEMSLPLFKTIITGYLKLNDLAKAKSACEWMEATGFEADHSLANAFLRCHAQHGHLADGLQAWHEIRMKFLQRRHRKSAATTTTTTTTAAAAALTPATPDERTSFLWASTLFKSCGCPGQLREVEEMASSRGIDVATLEPRLLLARHAKWFDHGFQRAKARQREIEKIAHQIQLFELDIRRHALDILASKIILSDVPVSKVRELFGKLARKKHGTAEDAQPEPEALQPIIGPVLATPSVPPWQQRRRLSFNHEAEDPPEDEVRLALGAAG